jgi:small subunit ribosomal protein S17
MSDVEKKKFKKKLEGIVVSNKSTKTIVVKVMKRSKHPLYSKFVYKTNKFHTHDELEKANIGDRVIIIESRPYSKLKKWELSKVLGN